MCGVAGLIVCTLVVWYQNWGILQCMGQGTTLISERRVFFSRASPWRSLCEVDQRSEEEREAGEEGGDLGRSRSRGDYGAAGERRGGGRGEWASGGSGRRREQRRGNYRTWEVRRSVCNLSLFLGMEGNVLCCSFFFHGYSTTKPVCPAFDVVAQLLKGGPTSPSLRLKGVS